MSLIPQHPVVHGIFDPGTWTVSYVVHHGTGTDCAIIDSVLNFDPKAGRVTHTSADRIIDHVKAHDLRVKWILETHAHADHISAASYLRACLGGMTGIGEHIDYAPIGRQVAFETTVAEHRAKNVHVREGIGEEMFVNMRTRRDATLGAMLP